MAGQLFATGAQLLVNTAGNVTLPTVATGRYIALLTADPTTTGPSGGYAQQISDLVEDTTAGYARAEVTFGPVPYSSSATYTTGMQVSDSGYVYSCAVASVSDVAPSGTATSTGDWTYIGPYPAYPAGLINNGVLTFGPYTAAQATPVGWAALVDVASGTSGNLLYGWTLPTPQQVGISQSIQIATGALTLTQS